MTQGKVSVIIPTYNNPEELMRSALSVINQSYFDIELIIIDDGSEIDYSSVISELSDKSTFPIVYKWKPNEGPGIARQFGLHIASGQYFQYLDSDDELLPDKIKHQVNVLNTNPDTVMVYGLSFVNKNLNITHKSKLEKKNTDDLLISVLQKRKWHTSSCLWNYPKGYYWEDLKNGEDVLHDFNIALKVGRKVLFTPEFVSNINFSESDKHLSNASKRPEKRERLQRDIIQLNTRILSRLSEYNMLKEREVREPLAERFFHSALVIAKFGYKEESILLLNQLYNTSFSLLKKIEIIIAKIIIIYFRANNKSLKVFFKLHRRLVSPSIHQYRNI